MTIAKLDDYNFRNKRVLIRVDFNVPLDKEGNILDDWRLKESVPTIQYLLDNGAQQIIMMAHLGRPKGEVVENLKMDKVAERFSEILGQDVAKTDDCVDIDLPYGRIVLLENLRFHKEEKSKNDWERQEFAKKLADYADYYVNDAFGTSHRKHASFYEITKYLPSCIGQLVEKEISIIGDALAAPNRPFIAIMGGVKVSDKLGAIKNLLKKVDALLLGGAMVFTFYKAMGKEIGKSKVEDDQLELARELLENSDNKIMLPVDVIAAVEPDAESESDVYSIDNIPKDLMGVDIGPETINIYKEIIRKAQTVVWNGPMGIFEIERFAVGTNEVADAVGECPGITIVGGGDSEEAIKNIGIADKITHVSTGGGAALEMFAGKKLIAIKALEQNYEKFKT